MDNQLKNATAEIRVHKYGICWIWSIHSVSGQRLKSNQNNCWILETKEQEWKFYSKADCLGKLRQLLDKVPKEFKEEFVSYQKIFDEAL